MYPLSRSARGIIEVLATSGNNHLGGDDFDERLVQGIVRKFKDKTRVDLTKDFAAMQRIKGSCGTCEERTFYQ